MISQTRDEAFNFVCEAMRERAELLIALLSDFAEEASCNRSILKNAALTIERELRSVLGKLAHPGLIGAEERQQMASEVFTILCSLTEASGFVKITVRAREAGERAAARGEINKRLNAKKSAKNVQWDLEIWRATQDEALSLNAKITGGDVFARRVLPGVARRLKEKGVEAPGERRIRTVANKYTHKKMP
jgi:hypothetical protein